MWAQRPVIVTILPTEEVVRGSFNAKCDVWSLGCCLYALLCHRPLRLEDNKGEGTRVGHGAMLRECGVACLFGKRYGAQRMSPGLSSHNSSDESDLVVLLSCEIV